MKSLAHDIEGRKGSAWLRRTRLHLNLTTTEANIGATIDAIALIKNAEEDIANDGMARLGLAAQ